MSCKKVMMDMGAPYNQQELVSFHTISKGALGECGMRGGMLEATNIHPETIDQLYKIASINLSPNTFGQVRLALLLFMSLSLLLVNSPGAFTCHWESKSI